jgi:hypothetical protein
MSGGGGKGDDKQEVPNIDPQALINQAIQANRVGVNTPYGSQLYSTDANGNAVLNTTLTPEMQALLSEQMGRASGPAAQYQLPSQNTTILNGLNTRLDQRYGMGLPPATPGSGGSTPGSGGGTGPVTPPSTPPASRPPIASFPPQAGAQGTAPGVNQRILDGTLAGTERFNRDEIVNVHDLLGPTAIQQGNLGPGPWASEGMYGSGENIGGAYYTPPTSTGFGIPIPGSGSGNYSDPSTGLPSSLPGGYLGSGSYSGMGQGLSATGTGTNGFGLPTGSVDLSGPPTNYQGGSLDNAGAQQAAQASGVSEQKKSLLARLLQSRVFRAAAPAVAGLLGGPLAATGVQAALRFSGNKTPAPAPAPNDSTFYNYNQ